MTIECYYKNCKYHSCNDDPDDGPFCYEKECHCTKEEMRLHSIIRKYELKDSSYNIVSKFISELPEKYILMDTLYSMNKCEWKSVHELPSKQLMEFIYMMSKKIADKMDQNDVV